MSKLRKLFGVPGIISLLAAGFILGGTAQQVNAEDSTNEADLLFECVQTSYGQNQNGEKTVEFSVVNDPAQSILENPQAETAKPATVAPATAAQVPAQVPAQASVPAQAKPTCVRVAPPAQNPCATPAPTRQGTRANPASGRDLDPARYSKPQPRVAAVPAQAQAPAPAPAPVPARPTVAANAPAAQPMNSPIESVRPMEASLQSPVGSNTDQELDEEENETVGPFTIYRESEELKVIVNRSLLMRTRYNLYRSAIVDPSVCDIVQFTPREISIIGRSVGTTHVTFWFDDNTFEPVTFTVQTIPDPSVRDRRAEQFKMLEAQIAKLFPNSKVTFLLLANKLIVRGQVRSAEEAREIMRILYEDIEQNRESYNNTAVSLDEETGLRNQTGLIIVNQLRIPGVQTVALKIKLADLSRSGGSSSGIDFSIGFDGDKVLISSLMGALTGGGGLISYNSANVKVGVDYLVQKGVVRQMSESTLVTMSGTSATFSTGGEIPVPTVTGVGGASAVTTGFRPYGTVINFTPTVMDKDLINLDITSEFSSLGDGGNKVSGVPNLDSRTLNSQVQMREGQTFCLATILEDNYTASKASNVPIISDLLGHRAKSRGEREMVILVSPELVAAMEADEVPPLPGFDVTEPTNFETHVMGRLEGNPTLDYRGTVWPNLRNRYLNGGSAIISGPYGH